VYVLPDCEKSKTLNRESKDLAALMTAVVSRHACACAAVAKFSRAASSVPLVMALAAWA
jgi:hypothetical protein